MSENKHTPEPVALIHAAWLEKSLTIGATEAAAELRRLHEVEQQRDELLDIMDAAARTLDRDGDEWGLAADFRAAIASVEGSATATCEKCNTPDLCREYGRACDPYELPETSVPAIVFYPAGSLGEEVQHDGYPEGGAE